MAKNNKILSDLFLKSGEKKPMKWLFPVEIGMVIYAIFSLFVVLFTSTSHANPEVLVWWRVRVVLLTVALWLVYRMWPCRAMAMARIALLLVTLSWWYPDTYVLNCHFQNMDHIFASWDQKLFGFQPALLWSKAYPSYIVSELMAMGYFFYFLMFVSLTFYVFFKRYEDFQKVSFILITSFFVYYVVFVLIPVAGPQYYYLAVGVDEIARGNFPEVGSYFAKHLECLPIPGKPDGIFRNLVQMSHNTGERPTAAFPSSHVGVSTLTMIIALWLKEYKFVLIWAVPWMFLCMGTVYLLPHYAVDAIAGFFTAIGVFFLLKFTYEKWFEK